MTTIPDEKILEMVRSEVAVQVAELRPAIRAALMEEMKFVTEAEGIAILPIQGKEPVRTFRRLMNDHGVHRLTLRGQTVFKRVGENSVLSVLEKLTVKPVARKSHTKVAKDATNLRLVEDAA
jgi:hypothetical protein